MRRELWCIGALVLAVPSQGRGPMRTDPYVVTTIKAALAKPGAALEYRLVTAESPTVRSRGAVRDSSDRLWLTLSDTVLARLPDADSLVLRFNGAGGALILWAKPPAAARVLEATRTHLGRRMAVMLNGTLLTAPVIAGEWAGRWGVAVGADSASGLALERRLQSALHR